MTKDYNGDLAHTMLNSDEWQEVRDKVHDDMRDADGIRTAIGELTDGQTQDFAHHLVKLLTAPSPMHEAAATAEIRRVLEGSLIAWRSNEARAKKRLDEIHARMAACEADY